MTGTQRVTAKQLTARRTGGGKRVHSCLARFRDHRGGEGVAPPHHIDVTGGKIPNVQG